MRAGKKKGLQTLEFAHPIVVVSSAACVGPLEGEGPLNGSFDMVYPDMLNGQKSWEKAESLMMKDAVTTALGKGTLNPESVDFMLAGDLLNQCISTNFAARDLAIPIMGVYGACSTMAQSTGMAAAFLDGDYGYYAVAAASSHHGTSERQYRYPTEYGGQKPPYSQHTVTGAGALLLSKGGNQQGETVRVTHYTVGKVIDQGIKDPLNMGAAMAPAAADTILRHFSDLSLPPDHYDLVLTGDLSKVGSDIVQELLSQEGLSLGSRLQDCGLLIYDRSKQPVFAGGSGCGCSAAVLCGQIMTDFARGNLRKVLLVGTGALLSPTSYQQGESIPCIAHAVAFSWQDEIGREGQRNDLS